jgi:hypothetical protein
MLLTATRYRQLILQKRWEARSDEEEKQLAMKPTLDILTVKNKRKREEDDDSKEQGRGTKRKASRLGG